MKYSEALEIYIQGLKIDLMNLKILNGAGFCSAKLGDFCKSLEFYSLVLK